MNNAVVVFRGGARRLTRGNRGGRGGHIERGSSGGVAQLDFEDFQNEFFEFMLEKRRLESNRRETERNPLNEGENQHVENKSEYCDKKLEKLEKIEEKMDKFVLKLNENTFFRVIADITVLTSKYFLFLSCIFYHKILNLLKIFQSKMFAELYFWEFIFF